VSKTPIYGKGNYLTEQFSVAFTAEDKLRIKEAAKKAGRGMGTWIRNLVLLELANRDKQMQRTVRLERLERSQLVAGSRDRKVEGAGTS